MWNLWKHQMACKSHKCRFLDYKQGRLLLIFDFPTFPTNVHVLLRVVAKMSLDEYLTFIQICKPKKTHTDVHTRKYNGPPQTIILRNNVGNWQLVWSTLIRQNNVVTNKLPSLKNNWQRLEASEKIPSFSRIVGIHLKLVKKNQNITTCNHQFDSPDTTLNRIFSVWSTKYNRKH